MFDLNIIFEYISSLKIKTLKGKFSIKFNNFFNSFVLITLPVGLQGEFKIISFVFSVIFSIISSAMKSKLFSSRKICLFIVILPSKT